MFIDSGLKENGKSSKEYPKWSSLRYGMDILKPSLVSKLLKLIEVLC